MVTILFTKAYGYLIKSCFVESSSDFKIIVKYPNGSEVIVETVKKICSLVESHDKWIKYYSKAA